MKKITLHLLKNLDFESKLCLNKREHADAPSYNGYKSFVMEDREGIWEIYKNRILIDHVFIYLLNASESSFTNKIFFYAKFFLKTSIMF